MSRNDQSINSSFIALLAQSAANSSNSTSPSCSSSQSGGCFSPSSSTSTTTGMTTLPNPFIRNLSSNEQEQLKEALNRSPF